MHAHKTKLVHFGLAALILISAVCSKSVYWYQYYSVLSMEVNREDSLPQLAVAVDGLHEDPQRPMISPRARNVDIKDNGILHVGQARVTLA